MSEGYGKLFKSMYDGTLYGRWQALVTFQQFVILCGPGGVVDMTPQAIAARTSIPLDIIQQGIGELEQPDPYSRTPDEEGRRIERLDDHRPWGWRIVNHDKYRAMLTAEQKREADRERIAAKRARDKKRDNGDLFATKSDKPANVAEKSDSVAQLSPESQMSQSVADVAHSSSSSSSSSTSRTGEEGSQLKRRPSKRAPKAFEPDPAVALNAIPDIDVAGEIAKFRDFEFRTPRSDWPAVWRNWIRTAAETGRYAKRKIAPRRPKTVAELEAEEEARNAQH